jgi:electron transfer flavoprotein beta subunit
MGPYDLIFAGRQAIDGDTAQVGPQIAEKLGLAQVTYVMDFSIDPNQKDITVKRQLEDGYEEIRIQAPCMLTAIKELNTPRYMTVNGIVHACSPDADIKVWNAKDVEVDLATVGLDASPTNVYRSFTPAPKPPGIKLEADGEKELAKLLLLKLKETHAI